MVGVAVLLVVIALLVVLVFSIASDWDDTARLLRISKSEATGHQDASEFWYGQCNKIAVQRDSLRAENDRLKKAASKLVMQISQDFGKDVTNPKAYE